MDPTNIETNADTNTDTDTVTDTDTDTDTDTFMDNVLGTACRHDYIKDSETDTNIATGS